MTSAVTCGSSCRVHWSGNGVTEYRVNTKETRGSSSFTLGPFTADEGAKIRIVEVDHDEGVKRLMQQCAQEVKKILPKTAEESQLSMSLLDGARLLKEADLTGVIWRDSKILSIVYFATGKLLDPRKLGEGRLVSISGSEINGLPIANFFAS